MATDYLSSCIDEIALEGLDGICVDALWLRLKDREPPFLLALDDKSKSYLWRLICIHPDLTFYELPTARGELVLTNRFKHTDCGTGIFLEQENYPEDIYPLEIISDKTIIGSCTTYWTRKDVTDQVRTVDLKANLTLKQVEERWGRKLVIVASTEARTAALYGPEVDPSLVLPEKHYCILERIGRARRQGELTHGKRSLLIFKEPSKTIFYLRKVLVRHGLITVQPFNQKLANGINGAGKCLHLKRFFIEYKPIYLGLLENLTMRLAGKPNKAEALTVIRSEMNMRDASFKKLYQFGNKYVKTAMIPHKDFYPDSTKEEYMIKDGTKERFIRVLALKRVYKYSSETKSDDDDDGSDAEDGDGAGKNDGVWNRVIELPLLHQAYQFARSKGERGASQTDFRQAFRASRLDGRLMARNLDRLGMVKTILQDQGKQRVQMFVAKEYIAGSALHKKLQIEKDKIVKLTLPKLEARERGESMPMSGIESPSSSRPGTPQHFQAESPTSGPAASGDANSDVKLESMLDLSCLDDTLPLIDTDNSCEKYHFKKRGAHVTYRLLKRANYILKAVHEAKLVDNIYQIQKKIIDDEAEEGYTCRCDKKSLIRLIERLARDGQIKSIKTLIKYGNEQKQLHFLCDPSISSTDQIVTSAIEAAKLRHIAVSKEYSKEIRRGEKAVEPNLEHSDLNMPNYGLLKSLLTMEDMQYDSDAGRRYGYKPRMLRLQMIHHLLFYLVYSYDLEAALVTSETVPPVPDDRKTTSNNVLESINDLKVYSDEQSWKRFIPPLPKHREYEEGWCLIGDVLLRLPVSIFCQIIRVNFRIAGLEELLGDPIGRYLTVGKLPSHMRQQLMIERKYIFSFYSNCISLCLMGLISFGKREWKQKEQIFIHVNRRATLVDTTETDEPMERRTEEQFQFLDPIDIDSYWFRLQWICLNTPIDAIVVNADPVGTNHSHAMKIERFNFFLEGHLPEDLRDEGVLPGNKLGAAGLDSTFFGHLRRNWSGSSGNLKAETLISEGKRRLVAAGRNVVKKPRKRKRRVSASDPGPTAPRSEVGSTKEPRASTSKARSKAQSEPGTKSGLPDKKARVTVRKVTLEGGKVPRGGKGVRRKASDTETDESVPAKRKRIMPGEIRVNKKSDIDDIDHAALKRMTKERVMWTPQEDSLLLLCEVASSILGGMRRDFLVQFTIVRDLMHRNFTTSLDKTSKACQRRIRYIMKNAETIANVNMYKGEALQDKELVEEFLAGKKYNRTPKNTNQLNKVFIDLVERLRQKFKTSSERAPLDLPDTLEEVARRYTLSRPTVSRKSQHKTVTSEKDIHFSVLHNVIHSAMVIQDKSGHANELYHVFSQYSDDLLQSVFNQMRADGIVTKIKAYAYYKETAGKRTMPGPSVAIGNYQMAQRYTYKWFSRYRKCIFLQAYYLLDKLCDVTAGERELMPVGGQGAIEDKANKDTTDKTPGDKMEVAVASKRDTTAEDTANKSPGDKMDTPATSKGDIITGAAGSKTPGDKMSADKMDPTSGDTMDSQVGSKLGKTTCSELCEGTADGTTKAAGADTDKTPDGQAEERCTEEGEYLEKAWRTKMMALKDEGVYVALIVSLMVQRKCLMETTIPDQVIVVESQCKHMSKSKEKGKKKLADLEKELHLGTASDEEEEALIEEAEKARLQQEGSTDGVGGGAAPTAAAPPVITPTTTVTASTSSLEVEWENKKTTSRTSLVLFRSQYANGPISVRMLAPQDHIVINSCTVRVKMVDAASPQYSPWPTETFNTLSDNCEYHRRWNAVHSWIHPRTCSRCLAIVRKLEPDKVDVNAFYRLCVSKWGFPISKVARIRDLLEEVTSTGVLGITDNIIKEKYGDCHNLDRMLGAMTEHHVIRRVGVTQPRYVAHQHLGPWLVHSYKNTKGRSSAEKKPPGVSEPFDFGPCVGTDDVDISGDVEFNVPPPPEGQMLLDEHLPAPSPERYKVLSLVRSVIVEDKYPGTEDVPDLIAATSLQKEAPTSTERGTPVETDMGVDHDKGPSENEGNEEVSPTIHPEETLPLPASPVPSTSTALTNVVFQPKVRIRLPRPIIPVVRPVAPMGPRVRLPVTQFFPGPMPLPITMSAQDQVPPVSMETEENITKEDVAPSTASRSAESMEQDVSPEAPGSAKPGVTTALDSISPAPMTIAKNAIPPKSVIPQVTLAKSVALPKKSTIAVTSPMTSEKPVTSSVTSVKPVCPQASSARPVTPPVTSTKLITPPVGSAKPVSPSVTATKPGTPSVTVTKPVTPSVAATKPVTPSVTATRSVTPSLTATKPVTPSVTSTKPVMPSVSSTKPVTPSVISAKYASSQQKLVTPPVISTMLITPPVTSAKIITPAVTFTNPVIPPVTSTMSTTPSVTSGKPVTPPVTCVKVVTSPVITTKPVTPPQTTVKPITPPLTSTKPVIPSATTTKAFTPMVSAVSVTKPITLTVPPVKHVTPSVPNLKPITPTVTTSMKAIAKPVTPKVTTARNATSEGMFAKSVMIEVPAATIVTQAMSASKPLIPEASTVIKPVTVVPAAKTAITTARPISQALAATIHSSDLVTAAKHVIPEETRISSTMSTAVAAPQTVMLAVTAAKTAIPTAAAKLVIPAVTAAKTAILEIAPEKPVISVVTAAKTAITPEIAGITRIDSISEGGSVPKFPRIPSILATRGLPSLECLGSRRVRTVSECSEGKQVDSQGTMVRLLEGITESFPAAGQPQEELTSSQRDEESMDTLQPPFTPTVSGREQYPAAQISLKDPSLLSRSQKGLLPHGDSPSQMVSPSAMQTAGQYGSSVYSMSPHQAVPLTSKSSISSLVKSPKGFSESQPFKPVSPRSPRALTNQDIMEMLQEPDTPSRSRVDRQRHMSTHFSAGSSVASAMATKPVTIQSVISPKALPSSTILTALQKPTVLSVSLANPVPSVMKSPQIAGSLQSGPTVFSSIREALMSPSIHTVDYSKPCQSALSNITPVVRKPPLPMRQVQPPPVMSLPNPQPLNPNVLRTAQQVEESRRIKDSLARRIARVHGAGTSGLAVNSPGGPAALAPDKGSFIDLPVKNLPGYESVKHMLRKSPKDTVRIKLPPGFKIPGGNTPVRFSIISEDQARKMGLSLPATGSTKSQVATGSKPTLSDGPLRSPSAAAGSAGAGIQSPPPPPPPPPPPQVHTQIRDPGIVKDEDADTIPQVDGAGDEKPSTSRKAPVKAKHPVTSGSKQRVMPDANVDSDDSTNKDSSDDSARQKGHPNKRSAVGRYSTFPKFKGRTPESSFHKLYQPVHLVPRPWRQTDGLVNKPTLKLMLESVLILIMSRPGITQEDVTSQYNPILQPVPILELLEMLEDIGCVRMLQIAGSHRSSLFSTRVGLTFDTKGTEKVYVPSVDCVLKLGQFEDQLRAAMSAKARAAMEADTINM